MFALLFPQKTKYKKQFKRFFTSSKKEYIKILPKRGIFCLKVLQSGRLFSNHIEAVKKIVIRGLKRKNRKKVSISIFPDNSVTQKSKGLRMGKGKGNVEKWACSIRRGLIVLQIAPPVKYSVARNLILKAGNKLPFKIKFFCCFF